MATFWEERLAAKKAQIVELEATMSRVVASGVYSHSLDTGQTRQSVTNHSITELRNMISKLEGEIAALEARCYGRGLYGRPGTW